MKKMFLLVLISSVIGIFMSCKARDNAQLAANAQPAANEQQAASEQPAATEQKAADEQPAATEQKASEKQSAANNPQFYVIDSRRGSGTLEDRVRLYNKTTRTDIAFTVYLLEPKDNKWKEYGTAKLKGPGDTAYIVSKLAWNLKNYRYFAIEPQDKRNYSYSFEKQHHDLYIYISNWVKPPDNPSEKAPEKVPDNFFPSKAGVELTYAQNDAKGSAQGYSVLTIKDVTGSGKNMTITYGAVDLDKDRKPPKDSPGEQIFQVIIKDSVMIMDINQMIPAQMKDPRLKIGVTGTPMELPSNLQPDQPIKDSEAAITIDFGYMKMNSVVKMTEGKCLAIEDVSIPSGTFKCHKITQKSTMTVKNTNTVETIVSWYAPNIGTVKTETYDDKNKLVSSTVLAGVKGN